MATAAESARSRDAAEARARAVAAAAVAYVASEMVAGREPSPDVDPLSPVMLASVAMALALMRSSPDRFSSDVPSSTVSRAIEENSVRLGEDIAKDAVTYAKEHWRTISERVRRDNPDATVEEIAAVYRENTPWQRAMARTITTRQASQTALDMVKAVDEEVGEEHRVVWISRGDHLVRDSHRRLHGKYRKPGSSFKSWPSGQKLAFPGDPRAPMDEWINCRCALILAPASSAHVVPDTLRIGESEWLAASAARFAKSQAEADLTAEIARILVPT